MMHDEQNDEARRLALGCWYLTGPTASGKTGIGIELAERIGAEIISLDSMTVYRDMNIGTAKPTMELRGCVPHHLIDCQSPTDEFSLAEYIDAALATIDEIRARGKEVLFVGGTPLYLKSLLRGIYQGPPADWEFREAVEREVQQVGSAALHERLAQVDPLSAAKLHPNDKRRIIRALEVYKVTGEPISHQQTHFDDGTPAEQCRVFSLSWPREQLHQRIDARVNWMFETGLVNEVRSLLDRYGELGRTASQAVGYRETIAHVRGEQDLDSTIQLVKNRTHQFARRQETWFRALCECRFVSPGADADPATAAERILACVEAS